MTIGLRHLLGLVLVAIGMVTATTAMLTIVDVTLLDDTPQAVNTPEPPSTPADEPAPPAPPRGVPEDPVDEPDDPPAPVVASAPDPPQAPATPVVDRPSVPAGDPPIDEPNEPDSGQPNPPDPDHEEPPIVEVPITPPLTTAGCGRDGKAEDWPWVERAGNQGLGVGWGPPVGGCGQANGREPSETAQG